MIRIMSDIPHEIFDDSAEKLVALANRLLRNNPNADPWEVADGLLAGAIHFWLFTRQPCERPDCEDCAPIQTADLRMAQLHALCEELAQQSEYFHSPNDLNAGHA